MDAELSQVAMADYRQHDWGARLRPLLDYAVALTRDPHGPGEAGIAALRAAGWSDEEILDATEIVGFFNYYNRLVDGLGVEDEQDW